MTVEVNTKNGYVKIANNLFDNIFIRDFTKRELEVILLIIRLSYGFNRKYAIIEPKTYLCLVGIPRQNINRTLDSLIEKNVIINDSSNIYRLNKHYDQWETKVNRYFDQDKINCLKALQKITFSLCCDKKPAFAGFFIPNYAALRTSSSLISNNALFPVKDGYKILVKSSSINPSSAP